jgi:hypothetical protein
VNDDKAEKAQETETEPEKKVAFSAEFEEDENGWIKEKVVKKTIALFEDEEEDTALAKPKLGDLFAEAALLRDD